MALSHPTLLPPGTLAPGAAIQRTEWFERKIGDFTLQAKIPCFHDEGADEWFVESSRWVQWEEEIVVYFIHNGYSGPEIDAFIKNHALSGR